MSAAVLAGRTWAATSSLIYGRCEISKASETDDALVRCAQDVEAAAECAALAVAQHGNDLEPEPEPSVSEQDFTASTKHPS